MGYICLYIHSNKIQNEEYIDDNPELLISMIYSAAWRKTLMRGWAKKLRVLFEVDWIYLTNSMCVY